MSSFRRGVSRLSPRWYADAGAISIYFASRAHLSAATRAFVDWVGGASGGAVRRQPGMTFPVTGRADEGPNTSVANVPDAEDVVATRKGPLLRSEQPYHPASRYVCNGSTAWIAGAQMGCPRGVECG